MAAHTLRRVQKIPVSLDKAWAFFSNPANLRIITPEDMDFRVLSGDTDGKMYPGQLIEYRVKPLAGIPVYWMTEITHVKDREYFIDEQRFGPYAFWHHQHHFREIPGGVEMTDIVHYKNPLWVIGKLANLLFVRKKLRSIFDYRTRMIETNFGKWKE